MKTADAKLDFPVLGFTPDQEIWGFEDLHTLTSCGPMTLKRDMQAGMEIIDSGGRRWRVRSIRRTGRAGPIVRWVVSALLSGKPKSRIEHELEELPAVSFPEIQARAVASVEATADNYCCDDEHETVLAPLLASVRSAKDVAEIHRLLGLDSFMGY